MSNIYSENKTAIMKWREKNPEKHREIHNRNMRALRLRQKVWKEVCLDFRRILIDELHHV